MFDVCGAENVLLVLQIDRLRENTPTEPYAHLE